MSISSMISNHALYYRRDSRVEECRLTNQDKTDHIRDMDNRKWEAGSRMGLTQETAKTQGADPQTYREREREVYNRTGGTQEIDNRTSRTQEIAS